MNKNDNNSTSRLLEFLAQAVQGFLLGVQIVLHALELAFELFHGLEAGFGFGDDRLHVHEADFGFGAGGRAQAQHEKTRQNKGTYGNLLIITVVFKRTDPRKIRNGLSFRRQL